MTNQDPIAECRIEKLEKRQGTERIAVETGEARARAQDELRSNMQFVVEELMPRAAEQDIPLDRLAELLGVSRQTLYRWRDELAAMKS